MRNWNSRRSALSLRLRISFQTTYEELKLIIPIIIPIIIRLPDYLWGIETYLWVLRSLDLLTLPDYLWGIETFLVVAQGLLELKASRLPMRNWNNSLMLVSRAICMLPDYLWGIETFFLGVEFKSWVKCFQTTYEELKLRSTRKQRLSNGLLPDYLWGIETLTWLIVVNSDTVASRLPMRNWNNEQKW